MVVPPFTALFAYSSGQNTGDKIPAFGTVLHNHLSQKLVFSFGPGAFISSLDLILLLETKVFQIWLYLLRLGIGKVCEFEPSVEALDLVQVFHFFGYLSPWIFPIFVNQRK